MAKLHPALNNGSVPTTAHQNFSLAGPIGTTWLRDGTHINGSDVATA